MNADDFYSLIPNCIKCNSVLNHCMQIVIENFPFNYNYENKIFTRIYGQTDIIFNNKPNPTLNLLHGYLAEDYSDSPFSPKNSFIKLISLCKVCCQYKYISNIKVIYDLPLDFNFASEQYKSKEKFIVHCNINNTIIYTGIPIKRITLNHKPLNEWIVNGDDKLIRDKITKIKLLL